MSKRILALAPHTDDVELGCGGSMARFLEEGKEIFWVVFSKAAVLDGNEPNIVLQELKDSSEILGIKSENLIVLDYQVRYLPDRRQEILEDLLRLKKDINPDLVLMPTLNDIHQDHTTVSKEGLRAFKHVSILGYEDPWNHLQFNSSSFIHLEEWHIRKKIEALEKYKSQSHKLYTDRRFIESLARARGVQIGTEFAEAFEVIRWVIP